MRCGELGRANRARDGARGRGPRVGVCTSSASERPAQRSASSRSTTSFLTDDLRAGSPGARRRAERRRARHGHPRPAAASRSRSTRTGSSARSRRRKDVDGFHPISAGYLLQGRPTFVAATPSGIMELLRAYEIPLEGARAVVVGRSNIVGKPMALLLLAENATVTVCHSRTRGARGGRPGGRRRRRRGRARAG